MNNQNFELFPEDGFDALRHIVAALGGAKKVGHKLWPHKAPDKAGEYLLACLNSGRNEKLDITEILWLLREARKKGYHGAMQFICADTGYDNPIPINPAQRRAELQERFLVGLAQLDEIRRDMEAMSK